MRGFRLHEVLALPLLTVVSSPLLVRRHLHFDVFLHLGVGLQRVTCGQARALPEHQFLLFAQEMLLWAQDASWPTNSDPADERGRGEGKMLHTVESYEAASTAEACLAVDGHASFVLLGLVEELFDDFRLGSGAVCEEQLDVLEALLDEALGVSGLLRVRTLSSSGARW